MDAAGNNGRRPAVSGCPPPEPGEMRRQQQHQQQGCLNNREQQCCCCAGSGADRASASWTGDCCCGHTWCASTPIGTAGAPLAMGDGAAAGGGEGGGGVKATRFAALRGESPTVSAATVSEWVARAAPLRCCLLESALPVKISLDGSEVAALQPPPPLLLLLLRNSYFPHIFATCYEHFQLALRPSFGEANRCPPSFTYQGKLLDWRVPVGVSFDCFAAAASAVGAAPNHRAPLAAATAQRLPRRRQHAPALHPCQMRDHAGALRQCAGGAGGRRIRSTPVSSAVLPCCFCSRSGGACLTGRAGDAPASNVSSSGLSSFVCKTCTRSCDSSCSYSGCCSSSADAQSSASSAPHSSHSAACGDAGWAADAGIAGVTLEQEQRIPTNLMEVNVLEASTQEDNEGEDETEEDAEEEELVIVDAAGSAGCAVALPWQLTVHFRTPAATLAAASNSRAAAVAAAIPANASRRDACCCSCAALRVQQQMPEVSAERPAATAAPTGVGGPAAGATRNMMPLTAGVSHGESAAAVEKNGNPLRSGNTGEISLARTEQAAAAGMGNAGACPPGREISFLKGEEGQTPAAASASCLTGGDRAVAVGTTPAQGLQSSAAVGTSEGSRRGAAAAPEGSSGSSVGIASSSVKENRGGSAPAAAREESTVVLPLVPPPAYEGWASFESFFTNVIRQAIFLLTGSAAAFHCLAKAEETALLRALRHLDVPSFLRAAAPLLTPLVLPNPATASRSLQAAGTHTQQLRRETERQLLRTQDRCRSQYVQQGGGSGRSSTDRVEPTDAGVRPSLGSADTRADDAAARLLSGSCESSTAVSASSGTFARADSGATLSSARDMSSTAEELAHSTLVERVATETPRAAPGRERVARAGPGGRGDVGANNADRSAATGAQRAEQASTAAPERAAAEERETAAGSSSRKRFGRTLRRLPVRVHLVSSCCSGAACSAAAGAALEKQREQVIRSTRVGGVSYAAAEGTMGGPCSSRGTFFMEDEIDATAINAEDSWCCVSSVLLACPPFVPSAASCSGSPGSFEPSSRMTDAYSFPHDRARCRYVSRVDISGHYTNHAGTEGCVRRKAEAHSSAASDTVAAAVPFASSVDGSRSTTGGRSLYTLGHMLHDLLPQLFPVKTWQLERKRVSQCHCSFVCNNGSRSRCCCCSVSPGLTDICKYTTKTRTTELVQQRLQQSWDYPAGSRRSNANTRKEGIGAPCGCVHQQEADRGTDACHSCCRVAKVFTQCTTEQTTGEPTEERNGVGEDQRWASSAGVQGAKREEEEDRAKDTDDEEWREDDLTEESLGGRLRDDVVYVKSSFQQRSGRRSYHACRVLVQGVEPLFDTPVYWLWLNAASLDSFLHVVVLLPPYL